MIRIGRNLDSDEDLYIDDKKSRAILICGKRGSGKSYSLGVIVEELFRSKESIILIVDPMGIYHTMSLPNTEQERLVWEWGSNPEGLPVKVLVPGDPVERYGGKDIIEVMESRNVRFESLRLNPSDVSPEGWCETFNIGINEPMGITLTKAIIKCKKKYQRDFFIKQIIDQIEFDTRASDATKDALINRLEMANEWGMFEDTNYRDIWQVLDPSVVNILDLSTIESGRYGRRPLILSTVCRDLFTKRSVARRKEELGLGTEMPKVWLFIDEAQQFIPSGKSSLAKEDLIRWVKEGRQPGLSLVVASQQPSAVDMEVLSQCDVIISHALTTANDKNALNKLTKDYMKGELKTYINKIARTGQSVIVDDDYESVEIVQIAPRKSKPGGSEA